MTDSLLPNETLQAQLSAFVDDELPAAETDLFVRRLVKDTELKQTMARYQLMGEALRAPGANLSRDFSARIAAALEQHAQPSVVAPIAASERKTAPRWLKPAGGMAIAASVALIAVLAMRQQPAALQDTLEAGITLEALQPVLLTAQRIADANNSYVVPAAATAPSAPIPATRLTNYVVAHSEFSSPLGRRNVVTGLLAGEHESDPVADTEMPAER